MKEVEESRKQVDRVLRDLRRIRPILLALSVSNEQRSNFAQSIASTKRSRSRWTRSLRQAKKSQSKKSSGFAP